MQTVRSREELAKSRKTLSGTVALVPTMGALHAGHMALVDEARRRADHVIASIFVNPMQFGAGEDLSRYPRSEAEDSAMLAEAGCDLLWLPSASDIYPAGFATTVNVAAVSERWEGEHRPGHFDGVATVVAKLFNAVRPTFAVFGEKDFQQLAVIRRMAVDLNMAVEVIGVPTVREKDGLALSSRNAYLSADERQRAVALAQALEAARNRIRSGDDVGSVLNQAQAFLTDAGFSRIDYLALVEGASLEPLNRPAAGARLIAAAVIGGTRLIDNLPLD